VAKSGGNYIGQRKPQERHRKNSQKLPKIAKNSDIPLVNISHFILAQSDRQAGA
jgi:hypothetical protein